MAHLAQGLGGDRPGVDAHPADDRAAFDDGRVLAELGGLDGRTLAGRARAHDDQVKVMAFAGAGLGGDLWCGLVKHVGSPLLTALARRTRDYNHVVWLRKYWSTELVGENPSPAR
jgi:hypothetical protein